MREDERGVEEEISNKKPDYVPAEGETDKGWSGFQTTRMTCLWALVTLVYKAREAQVTEHWKGIFFCSKS